MIERYRDIPYVKGGRDTNGLDCWGLVRLIREEIKGQVMPLFSAVDPLDKRSLTKSSIQCIKELNLKECNAAEYAIATGFRGKLCYHVGIVLSVDNKLVIAETDEPYGFSLTPINVFKSRYTQVKFYD